MTSIPRVWKRTDSKIYWITLPSGERISLKTRLRSDANKIALQITKILSTPKELITRQFSAWARTLPHSLQERLIALSVLPLDILDHGSSKTTSPLGRLLWTIQGQQLHTLPSASESSIKCVKRQRFNWLRN